MAIKISNCGFRKAWNSTLRNKETLLNVWTHTMLTRTMYRYNTIHNNEGFRRQLEIQVKFCLLKNIMPFVDRANNFEGFDNYNDHYVLWYIERHKSRYRYDSNPGNMWYTMSYIMW